MVKFNIESLEIIKQKIYEHTGQKVIVRDVGLLDSSIESVFQTYAGQELYPTLEEKGARLCYNIITNHPFVDGNKRAGILTMLCFLEINNVHLKYTNNELIKIGLSLASGKTSFRELVYWIHSHKVIKTANQNDEKTK